MASANNSAQDSGSDFDRFTSTWVHPAYASTDVAEGDSAPEKERVTQADLMASTPDPAKEVHGAMYRPSTTLKRPSAALGQVGFPHGYIQAADPNAAPAE